MFARFLATQLGHPSGRFGRVVGHLLNRSNRSMNRRAVAHLGVRHRQRLLDVGFGGGVGMQAMLEVSDDVFIAGLDHSEVMVQQQRARFRERIARGRMRLEQGDVVTMPFGASEFDGALACNAIYFWPRPVDALRKIEQVLKPEGRLVVACMTKQALERMPFTRHGYNCYDEDDVSRMLEEAGFDDHEIARAPDEPCFFAIAY